jgi:MFS family permease
MLERFKRKPAAREDAAADRGGVATAERGYGTRTEPRFGHERVSGHETAHAVRERQREEFGGINWGSAFFGWLVAVGMAAILVGLLSAAGAAFGLSEVSDAEAESNAEAIGIVGGILLILVLATAYYCGGYVSGRMSRFDGGRQGLAVWALGLAVTIALAVAGVLFGAEYNVLEQLNLPRIPVEEGSLTAGAAIALAAVLIATLVAAMGGGKAGERYHHKVDRFGLAASTRPGRVRAD